VRFGSLFAGIGGLDLGLERAGMECAWQVEVDDYCRRVLTKHWPDVPKYGDIRELNLDRLERVDLVAGGFPCQPVSVAGRRKAQEDDRWLWPEFALVLRGLRPRYALLENVPGLLTAGFGDVLADLASLGYDADWDCVPAAAVGAPHLRWRIFVIAHRNSHEHEGGAHAFRGASTSVLPAHTNGEPVQRGRTDARDGAEVTRQGSERVLRRGNGGADVAHTDGSTRNASRPAGEAVQGPEAVERFGRRRGLASAVADPERSGLEGQWNEHGLFQAGGPPGWSSWWTAEPDVGRVAHGVPARVDRLRALGNAVVPQVAEHVGRLILSFDEQVAA